MAMTNRAGATLLLTMALLFAPLFAGSCSVKQAHRAGQINQDAKWALIPVRNYSITPRAGEKAESIIITALLSRGVDLVVYPHTKGAETLLDIEEQTRYEQALAWAREGGYEYALTGSVEEYRYKIGLDGEPVVGVSIRLIDVKTEKIVISASGSRTGWGRASLSGTAHRLVNELVSEMMAAD